MRSGIVAIAVALALPALAEDETKQPSEPSLELVPLVPPEAPWMKKPPAKEQAKKRKKATPPTAQPPAAATAAPKPAEVPIPPLAPVEDVPPLLKLTNDLGVLFQNDGLEPAVAARVQDGLLGVARAAPLTKSAVGVQNPPTPCADDACLAALARSQKVDQLLFASYARQGATVRAALIDALSKKRIATAEQAGVASDQAVAWAEALGCKLLIPAGCTGEVSVDALDGVQVELDGAPLARGEKRKVAVGVHLTTARLAGKTAQRALPVTREGAPALVAQQVDGEPRILLKGETPRPAAPPVAVVTSSPAPGPSGARWTKPAGIAALALGAAAAATGVYFGAKSRSDLNQAEAGYRSAQGTQSQGAYRPSDLAALQSGNTAAHRANALFVAAGALAAAGLLLTVAF
jgi:hypothetical protein